MTSSDLDQAADAALAAALADLPTGDDQDTVEGRLIGAEVEASAEAGLPCTREEAEQLVAQARAALVTLSETMWQIIHRRAWAALGYDTPHAFWVKEFGQLSASEGGFSRVHLYRTARVIGLLYQLFERLGEDAEAIELTERALRAIPRGPDGVNDVALVDEIAKGVEALGPDYTVADVQQIVNDKVKAAREQFKPAAGEAPDAGHLAERLKALGLDPDSLLRGSTDTDGGDEHHHGGGRHSHDGGQTWHDDHDDDGDDWSDDADDEDPRPIAGGIGATTATSGGIAWEEDRPAAVSDDAYTAARKAAEAAAALTTLSGLADTLPDLVTLFTPDETAQIPTWAAALRACADALDSADDVLVYDPDDL